MSQSYLVEFAEVGGVHRLITKDAVDGEVFLGLESSFLVGEPWVGGWVGGWVGCG